jgi:hypothetical protein
VSRRLVDADRPGGADTERVRLTLGASHTAGTAPAITCPSNGTNGTPFGLLSAFGNPDDRLAGNAPVGGESGRCFGERPC